MFRFLPCIVTGVVLSTLSARANVYATDIKLNGSLSTITDAGANPVTISYRLNQAATLGVAVTIWQGTTPVAVLSGGTNMGLNSVVWGGTNDSGTNVAAGTYSLSITASASGFTNWAQISVDTNAGMPAYFPVGMAVDNNTNSPYYGRVIVGCPIHSGTATNVPVAAQMTGFYKMNADGSQADEGWYGNASYTNDDGGDGQVAGQIPDSGGYDPMKIRIGDDDRIYWVDNSYYGAIVACDIQAKTNQVVICDYPGVGGGDRGPSWSGMSDWPPSDGIGFQEFDVTATTTSNAAVWLCDNDYPNWGIWMFRMTNGVADTNDITGTEAVATGADLALVSSGGCTIDANLDIFVSEDRNGSAEIDQTMVFTNWNGGVLPPENGGFNYTTGTVGGQVEWGDQPLSTNDFSWESIRDTVIDKRVNPTMVALSLGAGNDNGGGGGIKVLNVADGSVVTVTNSSGTVVQTLTNIDWNEAYRCCAWDNVGNLYGASVSLNLWRVWSPPGTNSNTTVAVAKVIVTAALPAVQITSVSAVPTGAGCATVTINFTGPTALPVSSGFTVVGSPTVNGTYSAVTGVVISAGSGPGSYVATFSNCSTAFFEIELYNIP